VGTEERLTPVAAYATPAAGGLLLIGFKALVEDGEEVVSELGPIPRAKVDVDQYRKIIRERVMPPPRGLRVEWLDCGNARGILVIDIPAQSRAGLPFVIPGPSGNDKTNKLSIAVPVREADGTHWLPQSEIRRLLALGWAEAGGPSDDVVVGAGEPGWKRQFRDAYDRACQLIRLGRPVTEVYRAGPGVVQCFEPNGSANGWVLCALPDCLPVLVTEVVWEALHAAGSGEPGGDALDALGLPFVDANDVRPARLIDEQVAVVDLRGGRWGDGRLVRGDVGHTWSWEPQPSFSPDVTRSAANWTAGGTPPQLRVRAIATLPWTRNGNHAISAAGRREFSENLSGSDLAGAVTTLSLRRGAKLRAADWSPGPNRNALDAASFSTTIKAPDRRSALSGEVMIALPNSMCSAVVACAELRVDDLAAWADALQPAGGPAARKTSQELECQAAAFSTRCDQAVASS
jgi:hypothetical protein